MSAGAERAGGGDPAVGGPAASGGGGTGSAAKAIVLWVVVTLGLLYGVINTLLNVVDLFTA